MVNSCLTQNLEEFAVLTKDFLLSRLDHIFLDVIAASTFLQARSRSPSANRFSSS
jgi:hypothetical protein